MEFMEPTLLNYDKNDFIETVTGNKVCKKSILCGSQNIRLQGQTIIKKDVMIRGDLASITIGKHCILNETVLLRPSYKNYRGGIAFFPMSIGDNVYIGERTTISAATIGSFVDIGKNCTIGKRCIIKDCTKIEDNSIIPSDTVVSSFSIFSGYPAKRSNEILSESFQFQQGNKCVSCYEKFQPI